MIEIYRAPTCFANRQKKAPRSCWSAGPSAEIVKNLKSTLCNGGGCTRAFNRGPIQCDDDTDICFECVERISPLGIGISAGWEPLLTSPRPQGVSRPGPFSEIEHGHTAGCVLDGCGSRQRARRQLFANAAIAASRVGSYPRLMEPWIILGARRNSYSAREIVRPPLTTSKRERSP